MKSEASVSKSYKCIISNDIHEICVKYRSQAMTHDKGGGEGYNKSNLNFSDNGE
jgi:hypothetical protein